MIRHTRSLATCCALTAVLMGSTASAALLRYEPFNYSEVGATLQGKMPDSAAWARAGAADPPSALTIANGSLATPSPLVPAAGNSLRVAGIGNSNGSTNRLALGQTISTVGSTVYYSLALRVDELTGSNSTNGGFFLALNSSTGSQTTNPTAVAARLYARIDPSDDTKYNLTIARNRDLNAANPATAWSGPLNLGDTQFLVASYEIVDGTNNDLARLWINPAPTTFGDVAFSPGATPPTITDNWTGNGNDITIQSIAIRQSAAPYLTLDELRVGTDWASVTPPVPEPTALTIFVLGFGAVGRRKRIAALDRDITR